MDRDRAGSAREDVRAEGATGSATGASGRAPARMETTETPGVYKRGSRYSVTWRDERGKQRWKSLPTYELAIEFKAALKLGQTAAERQVIEAALTRIDRGVQELRGGGAPGRVCACGCGRSLAGRRADARWFSHRCKSRHVSRERSKDREVVEPGIVRIGDRWIAIWYDKGQGRTIQATRRSYGEALAARHRGLGEAFKRLAKRRAKTGHRHAAMTADASRAYSRALEASEILASAQSAAKTRAARDHLGRAYMLALELQTEIHRALSRGAES